jgi:hypothetical protein
VLDYFANYIQNKSSFSKTIDLIEFYGNQEFYKSITNIVNILNKDEIKLIDIIDYTEI